MTLKLRLAAAALLLAGSLSSAARAQDTRTPLLYQIEDADSRVTLLGSVHILPADAYPLPPSIDAAYAAADLVAVEVDIEDIDALAASVAARATYADDTTLAEVLGKAAFGKLSRLLTRLGLPPEGVATIKPWAVQFMLTSLATADTGYRADLGLDLHLIQRARADGKALLPLETADDQIAMFDDMPRTEQVADLIEMVRFWGADGSDGADELADLIGAWGRGDEAALAEIAGDLSDAILRDRNALWVPQIEAMLAREGEDVLVVVGAAHLVGDASVVMMLRERGLAVTRIAGPIPEAVR